MLFLVSKKHINIIFLSEANMKIKYNFGLIKGMDVGFRNGKSYYHNILKNVKKYGNKYHFEFENFYMEISESDFLFFKLECDKQTLWFTQTETPILSGLAAFTMFDTYGFPIEMTKEIMEEDGFMVDIDGFYILQKIQKERTKNTFKKKNAF